MKKKIDEYISGLLLQDELPVPERLDRHIESQLKQPQQNKKHRWLHWVVAAPLAASLLLALLLKPLTTHTIRPEPSVISEIRSEFELKDKNIKIIWFQKKDFNYKEKK